MNRVEVTSGVKLDALKFNTSNDPVRKDNVQAVKLCKRINELRNKIFFSRDARFFLKGKKFKDVKLDDDKLSSARSGLTNRIKDTISLIFRPRSFLDKLLRRNYVFTYGLEETINKAVNESLPDEVRRACIEELSNTIKTLERKLDGNPDPISRNFYSQMKEELESKIKSKPGLSFEIEKFQLRLNYTGDVESVYLFSNCSKTGLRVKFLEHFFGNEENFNVFKDLLEDSKANYPDIFNIVNETLREIIESKMDQTLDLEEFFKSYPYLRKYLEKEIFSLVNNLGSMLEEHGENSGSACREAEELSRNFREAPVASVNQSDKLYIHISRYTAQQEENCGRIQDCLRRNEKLGSWPTTRGYLDDMHRNYTPTEMSGSQNKESIGSEKPNEDYAKFWIEEVFRFAEQENDLFLTPCDHIVLQHFLSQSIRNSIVAVTAAKIQKKIGVSPLVAMSEPTALKRQIVRIEQGNKVCFEYHVNLCIAEKHYEKGTEVSEKKFIAIVPIKSTIVLERKGENDWVTQKWDCELLTTNESTDKTANHQPVLIEGSDAVLPPL